MNTSDEQQSNSLQRDKEIRSEILSEFFARVMWLDAAAVAAIVAFLAEHGALKPATLCAAKIAAIAFAVSLAIAIFVPLRRVDASFHRGKRDCVSAVMQWSVAALAAFGVIMVGVALLLGLEAV